MIRLLNFRRLGFTAESPFSEPVTTPTAGGERLMVANGDGGEPVQYGARGCVRTAMGSDPVMGQTR